MFFIIVSVFKPKKSIFNIPTCSTNEPSYCVINNSQSFSAFTGRQFINLSGAIITPQACIPVCLLQPSKTDAFSNILCSNEFSLSYNSFNSGINGIDSNNVGAGIFHGINLVILLACSKGIPNTLATSLIATFAAIVLYVIRCATLSLPYLLTT